MDYETEQDNLYTVGSILRSKPVEEPTVVSDSGIAVANDTDPNHPNQNPEEDTHGQSFITKALSGTSSVGSDVGKAIVKGGAKGAEETLYGAAELIGAPVDFVNFIASKVPGVGQYISSDMPIGGSDSIKYVSNIGMDTISSIESELLSYATEKLHAIDRLKIIGTANSKASVISFNYENIHPFDIGTLLDQLGVAIRTGHHCTQPLMDFYNIPGTARASFAFYNTKEDIDIFIEALKKSLKMLY